MDRVIKIKILQILLIFLKNTREEDDIEVDNTSFAEIQLNSECDDDREPPSEINKQPEEFEVENIERKKCCCQIF